MSDQRIEAGKIPHVIITCLGNLRIHAWEKSELLIKGDDFNASQSDKGISVQSKTDLRLYLPMASSMTVANVHGDTRIKGVKGLVTIAEVKGDLALRGLDDVTVATVHGDLTGRDLASTLIVEEVMGDVSLRNVHNLEVTTIAGDCSAVNASGFIKLQTVMGDVVARTVNGEVAVDACHRDVNLRNLGGLITVGVAHGDIRLRGGLTAGKHNLNAKGDIVVRWPAGTPVNLEANAPQFRNRLTLVNLVQSENYLSGRIGDGATFLILSAKGRIILKEASSGRDPWEDYPGAEFDVQVDLNGLGEHIANEINDRMTEWSTRLDQDFGPAFTTKIEETALAAAEKAEKAAEKAVRKAEKAAKKARWQMDQSTWSKPAAPPPTQSKEKRATEEEQLKVLRMVEKGIISPEEANSLLEAIES
jgi:hypothetical protein